MNASIEAKKAEAVERMKLWGIYPPIIKCFEQEGIVSESAPPLGTCSQLEGEQLERVRKFEEKYNAVVYHVIHSFTNIGELESYLFVSDRPDEWETDRKDLKSGQPLVKIDDRIYRQRVAQGTAAISTQTANLDNSQQTQRSSEAQIRLQDAAVAAARAQLSRAQADMRRVSELVSEGSVSLRERDQTLAALRQAEAALRQAEAQRAIAVEQSKTVVVGRSGLQAQVANAVAARDLARIDLDNTVIRAPRDGRLSEVSVRVGQLVQPGAQLMYLVPGNVWIVANFKEAQTAKIRVGQHATLSVDALGGQTLKGTVENVSPAAGSEFSVIKPDTGSGNFVKVPQRVAVRIRINPGQELAKRLGPGMSVVAKVDTRDVP